MTEEDHLENLLKIIAYDDFDEESMRRILAYVQSRGLLDVWPEMSDSVTEEINNFLSEQPPVELLTRVSKPRP